MSSSKVPSCSNFESKYGVDVHIKHDASLVENDRTKLQPGVQGVQNLADATELHGGVDECSG